MARDHVSPDLPALSRERSAIAKPLLERVTRAMAELVAEAPLDALQRASAAATGAGSIAELISRLPSTSPRLAAADPEAAAVARAAVMKREILESIATFSTGEVAGILGITAEGVRKRRLAGKVLALPLGSDFRYPAWQFVTAKPETPVVTGGGDVARSIASGGAMLPGLDEVLAAMPVESPWVRYDLLTAVFPDDEEGRSVLGLIRAGKVERARAVVAAYGEQAA